MWNLKYGTNKLYLQNRNILTDTESKVIFTKSESRGKENLELTDTNYYRKNR